MSNYLNVLIALALVLNLCCAGYIAWAVRQRHRLLFNRTEQLRDAMTRLADELRIEIRLSEIQRVGTCVESSLPVRFAAQAGEDILIYDFFREAPPGFLIRA